MAWEPPPCWGGVDTTGQHDSQVQAVFNQKRTLLVGCEGFSPSLTRSRSRTLLVLVRMFPLVADIWSGLRNNPNPISFLNEENDGPGFLLVPLCCY